MTPQTGWCFRAAFEALTGCQPFPWQCELFRKFMAGDIPRLCDIPTGLGKTSIIHIWLIALAESVGNTGAVVVPRRLVYVVNRRTIVDQATEEAERLRERVANSDELDGQRGEILKAIKRNLLAVCAVRNGPPLAVSTLRGELADNGEWKLDPARPAIIIGTVDMVGSKLLFSGYGDGLRLRPHHAGLIGQDTLLVHDESHLTPAFSELLYRVADIQEAARELRPIKVIELSATRRDGAPGLTLSPEDHQHSTVLKRLNARKTVWLHECAQGELPKKLAELALKWEPARQRVIVYVRRPEDAQSVAGALRQKLGPENRDRVALLTGTLRGYERDRLVKENPVIAALLGRTGRPAATLYLVSTSAGELGVNFDADHMVCDLAPLDSVIQRLGRVNRFGEGAAEVHVVAGIEDPDKQAADQSDSSVAIALEALRTLPASEGSGFDASPAALRGLAQYRGGWSQQPKVPWLDEVLLDAWSLTSLDEDMPGRPPVAAWLHGLAGEEPDTFVAWRAEVQELWEAEASDEVVSTWFRRCPIRTHERLREPTRRVRDKLRNLLSRLDSVRAPIVLVDSSGKARMVELAAFLRQEAEGSLEYCTVVLPAQAGGLSDDGTFDPSRAGDPRSDMDVAELRGERKRFLLWEEEEGQCSYRPLVGEEIASRAGSAEEVSQALAAEHGMSARELLPLCIPDDEIPARYLLLLVRPSDPITDLEDHAAEGAPAVLDQHLEATAGWVRRITAGLDLPPSIREALELAARWHDRGKNRLKWQRAVFNDRYPQVTLAKAGNRTMNWRLLSGYRHELGSLLELQQSPDIQAHPERDLVLHLVAAHHGRGRPHFPPSAYDNELGSTPENQEAVREAVQRFARLQRRFGRWGLAWLESLLRCADALASRQAPGAAL